MNRPIRKVAVALGVLLAAIFVNINFVQVVKNNAYNNTDKYADNRLPILAEYSSPRGQIDVQGSGDRAVGRRPRTSSSTCACTPTGPIYAPVTGFNSIIYGTDGHRGGRRTRCCRAPTRASSAASSPTCSPAVTRRGGSVELTLNKAAQQAAYAAMKTCRTGSCAAARSWRWIRPPGRSSPPSRRRPTTRTSSARTTRRASRATTSRCRRIPRNPMLDRALNQTYAPGSVFKVIVSAAALKAGIKPDQLIPAPNGYWPFHDHTGACPNNPTSSCVRTSTARPARTARPPRLPSPSRSRATPRSPPGRRQARRQEGRGRGVVVRLRRRTCQVPISVASSTVGSAADLADPGSLAHTSFGQQDVRMSPLQGAMIAAAVANGGSLMTPYLVRQELELELLGAVADQAAAAGPGA